MGRSEVKAKKNITVHNFVVHKLVYQCFLLARRICETVENLSSYVQKLAWNILAETDASGVYLEDPIFKMWFKREYMK